MYTFDEVNTLLGAYAREHFTSLVVQRIWRSGQGSRLNAMNLFDRLFARDELALVRAKFDSNMREHRIDWDPVGPDVTFTPDLTKLRNMKEDVDFHVNAHLDSYLNMLAGFEEKVKSRQSVSDDDIPGPAPRMANWYFENKVNKMFEQFEKRAVYAGVYASGSNDFATNLDGVEKMLLDRVADLSIPAGQVVATGAVDHTNAYEKFEMVGDAVPDHLLGDELFAICSFRNYKDYSKSYASNFAGANALIHDGYKRTMLRESDDITLVPWKAMGSSDRIIIVPRDEIYHLVDHRERGRPQALVNKGSNPESLQIRFKMSAAFGVKDPNNVVISDPTV